MERIYPGNLVDEGEFYIRLTKREAEKLPLVAGGQEKRKLLSFKVLYFPPRRIKT